MKLTEVMDRWERIVTSMDDVTARTFLASEANQRYQAAERIVVGIGNPTMQAPYIAQMEAALDSVQLERSIG
jgi:hypothetical protein